MITDKPDVERDAVADVWSAAGGEVLRLGRFWDPPTLDPKRVRVYGADSYCQKSNLDQTIPALTALGFGPHFDKIFRSNALGLLQRVGAL